MQERLGYAIFEISHNRKRSLIGIRSSQKKIGSTVYLMLPHSIKGQGVPVIGVERVESSVMREIDKEIPLIFVIYPIFT